MTKHYMYNIYIYITKTPSSKLNVDPNLDSDPPGLQSPVLERKPFVNLTQLWKSLFIGKYLHRIIYGSFSYLELLEGISRNRNFEQANREAPAVFFYYRTNTKCHEWRRVSRSNQSYPRVEFRGQLMNFPSCLFVHPGREQLS